MKTKLLSSIAAVGILSLSGCATVTPMNNTFNPTEVEWVKEEGDSIVTGQSFLRTNGGSVVTCAGYEVSLVPVAPYSEERMTLIYGNQTKGYRSLNPFAGGKNPGDAPADYVSYTLNTICDATGTFEFSDVPAGQYFITSGVTWNPTGDAIVPEGGYMMQRIDVKPSTEKKYILTH
ncbi:hypothetical protein ABXV18_24670 [Vibrio owensii]|uniref:hypothetical protein n=1 Tax=Vibrio owensii TaxID=696485 RepID=UPI003390C9C1